LNPFFGLSILEAKIVLPRNLSRYLALAGRTSALLPPTSGYPAFRSRPRHYYNICQAQLTATAALYAIARNSQHHCAAERVAVPTRYPASISGLLGFAAKVAKLNVGRVITTDGYPAFLLPMSTLSLCRAQQSPPESTNLSPTFAQHLHQRITSRLPCLHRLPCLTDPQPHTTALHQLALSTVRIPQAARPSRKTSERTGRLARPTCCP